jgi:hypothetical protein
MGTVAGTALMNQRAWEKEEFSQTQKYMFQFTFFLFLFLL